MTNSISSLRKNEDYWAIWIAFIVIAGVLSGILTKVPKIGKWSDDPLTPFLVIKAGVVVGNILLSLLVLMLGLGLLTAITVAVMKAGSFGRNLAGFAVLFVLACIANWIANQVNIKYWGLSYALWALLLGLLVSNTSGAPGGCRRRPRASCSSKQAWCCWAPRSCSKRLWRSARRG